MTRSTFLTLLVAAGATVLATSVVPAGRAGAPLVADPSPPHAVSGPGPPTTQGGSSLHRSGSAVSGTSGAPAAYAASGASGRHAGAGYLVGGGSGTGQRPRWQWPLPLRPPVLRPFRAPQSDYGAGHRGLDLAATDGAPVVAVEGGVVTHSGRVAGRGTITVTHVDGLSSTYEPLDPLVGVGAVVSPGDLLGVLRARDGPGHCGSRVCLHLGARRGESYLDPYPLLAGGRVALLPLG